MTPLCFKTFNGFPMLSKTMLKILNIQPTYVYSLTPNYPCVIPTPLAMFLLPRPLCMRLPLPGAPSLLHLAEACVLQVEA